MDEKQFADLIVLIALLTATAYIAFSLRLVKRQATSVIAVVNCIFFAVYILPTALDLIVRDPDFGHLVGYNDAASDSLARIYSAFSLCLAPVIWTEFARYGVRLRKDQAAVSTARPNPQLTLLKNIALMSLAASPLLLLPMAPRLDVYATYGPLLPKVGRSGIEELNFHAYLNQCVFYSMLSCFAMLIGLLRSSSRLKLLGICVVLCLLAIDCYLHGKRTSVALVFCSLVFCIWYTEAIKRSLLVPLLIGSTLLVSGFSHWYQITFSRTEANTFEEIYDGIRLEFSRDHAHKFVIYNSLIEDGNGKILNYFGESLVIYATLPIPRSMWPDKPVSYAMSLTCTALGLPRHYLGWGVTSSILDESIANFGIVGMLIGPLFFGVILRCSLQHNRAVFRLVTTILCLMLMMVHLSSCLPMLLGWLMVFWKSKFRHLGLRLEGQ